MAWNYARYVDHVAAAGKSEYAIPMYVNACLGCAGGGPMPRVMDMWLAGAPHVDILSPDAYGSSFPDWCERYTRRGNPLFIPEMSRDENAARNLFFAIGQHDAIGTSPFAVDSIPDPANSPLARSYAVLQQARAFDPRPAGRRQPGRLCARQETSQRYPGNGRL